MSKKIRPYQLINLVPARQAVLNFLELSSWERYMFALVEVDVTVARQFMEDYQARTGERLSFTGYLSFCLARAIDEDKQVQGYLKGRKKLVVFDDVDVGIMVEHQIGGKAVPVGHVIRGANHKTFRDIHGEIRALQTGPALASKMMPFWLRLLPQMPWPFPALILKLIRTAKRQDPARLWVPMAGTVGVSAIGMFGNGSGWGLVAVEHTLALIVGSITRKPAIVEDRIEPREILNLTVAIDHRIVDGAPAARFVRRLVDLIESGYGLEENPTEGAATLETE